VLIRIELCSIKLKFSKNATVGFLNREVKRKLKKAVLVSITLLLSMVALASFPMPVSALAKEGPAYIVVFSGWNLPADVDAIIAECGGRVGSKLPNIGVVTALPTIDPAAFEFNLNQRSEIIDFGHDYVAEVPDYLVIPVNESVLADGSGPKVIDPYYWTYQWHLWHTIEASPKGAWSITTGTHDVKVAILDTGIDYNHGDLAPNYDFALSKSFVDWNFDGTIDEPEIDENGHGSHCAGNVAAAINNNPNDWKCVGIGPNLDLVNLKVMGKSGSGYFSWDFDAIYYAVEKGVDVVSMSFGAYVPMAGGVKEGGSALFSALQRLFNYANRNGIVCIASAGNLGLDMDGLHSWRHLPSQCSNVICVIGTDIYDDIAHTAWGSNYGSCLHGISAPGGDFAYREPKWYKGTIPPAYWRYWYGLIFSCDAWTTTGYRYVWMGGTSMAAPQVAGVAGLILSVKPGLNPSQVQYFLQQGAEDIGDPGYDQYFNFGLLNAYNSVLLASGSR